MRPSAPLILFTHSGAVSLICMGRYGNKYVIACQPPPDPWFNYYSKASTRSHPLSHPNPLISHSSGSAHASDVYAWVGMHPILGMTNFHHTFQRS